MTTEELLKALARLRVETGSLSCLGCGHEHNCSVHGCYLLTEAWDKLDYLRRREDALYDEVKELWVEVNSRGNALHAAEQKRAEAEDERDALREKAPRWISVEDRLPSPGARVLITDGVFVGEGFLVWKAFFGHGEGTSWKRYSNIPWNESMKTEITHWMPLPEAPEEGGKDADCERRD